MIRHEVGLDVTVAMVVPVASEGVVAVTRWQRGVGHEQVEDSG